MIDKKSLTRFVKQTRQNNDTWYYNCWNFTALLEQWVDDAFWMDLEDIQELLDEHTYQIDVKDLQYGDILVYANDEYSCYGEEITHTAFYLGNGKVIHKPGHLPIEKISMHKVLIDTPEYGELFYCARPYSTAHDEPVPATSNEGQCYQMTLI